MNIWQELDVWFFTDDIAAWVNLSVHAWLYWCRQEQNVKTRPYNTWDQDQELKTVIQAKADNLDICK